MKYTNCIDRAWTVGSLFGIIVKQWRSEPNHSIRTALVWPHPESHRNHGPVGNVHLSARFARLVMGHAIIVAECTVADLPHTYGSIVEVHFAKPPEISNTGMTVSRALQLCKGSRLSFGVL